MSVPRSALRRCLAALFCAAAVPCSALAQDTTPAPTQEVAQTEKVRVAILPIRVHSARSLGYLTDSLSEVLGTQLSARDPGLEIVDPAAVLAATGSTPGDLQDAELRQIAEGREDRAWVEETLKSRGCELA